MLVPAFRTPMPLPALLCLMGWVVLSNASPRPVGESGKMLTKVFHNGRHLAKRMEEGGFSGEMHAGPSSGMRAPPRIPNFADIPDNVEPYKWYVDGGLQKPADFPKLSEEVLEARFSHHVHYDGVPILYANEHKNPTDVHNAINSYGKVYMVNQRPSADGEVRPYDFNIMTQLDYKSRRNGNGYDGVFHQVLGHQRATQRDGPVAANLRYGLRFHGEPYEDSRGLWKKPPRLSLSQQRKPNWEKVAKEANILDSMNLENHYNARQDLNLRRMVITKKDGKAMGFMLDTKGNLFFEDVTNLVKKLRPELL